MAWRGVAWRRPTAGCDEQAKPSITPRAPGGIVKGTVAGAQPAPAALLPSLPVPSPLPIWPRPYACLARPPAAGRPPLSRAGRLVVRSLELQPARYPEAPARYPLRYPLRYQRPPDSSPRLRQRPRGTGPMAAMAAMAAPVRRVARTGLASGQGKVEFQRVCKPVCAENSATPRSTGAGAGAGARARFGEGSMACLSLMEKSGKARKSPEKRAAVMLWLDQNSIAYNSHHSHGSCQPYAVTDKISLLGPMAMPHGSHTPAGYVLLCT